MSRAAACHGLLLVDKPAASSSHRVVAVTRRALGMRAVGHAGTLDPMATGLLVLGVGEGTKLLGHLGGDDKRYEAELRLGQGTDSLDADGTVIETCAVPDLGDAERIARAVEGLVGERLQVPPAISAIKQQGVALYERVRRGEEVVVAPRQVVLHSLDVSVLSNDTLRLSVHCGKGYYVRALGRDLAIALGSCGHLARLRRVTSGAFDVANAVPFAQLERAAAGEPEARAALRTRVIGLRDAVAALPGVVVDAAGREDARQGRVVVRARAVGDSGWPAPGTQPVALLSEAQELIALARATERGLEVMRGFRPDG